MTHIVHVNAACRDVCRHKHSNLFTLEISKRFLTAVLALVAVNRSALDTSLFKNAHNLIGTVLCSAKHKHLFHFRVFRQEFLEERSLTAFVNAVKFLTDAFNRSALRSNFHPHRVRSQNRRSKFQNFIRHRCAKEQILSIRREHRDHFADIMDKAHVEHAVGFVEHKEFQLLQRNSLLPNQIKQAPRSCNKHIDTANQVALLRSIAHTTKNACRRNRRELRISLEAIFHLNRKFTSRQKNQCTASLWRTELPRIQQTLQNRERKRSRLTRPRLSNSQEILAFEQARDGSFLNRGRGFVTNSADGPLQRICQRKFFKFHTGQR